MKPKVSEDRCIYFYIFTRLKICIMTIRKHWIYLKEKGRMF